MKSLKKILCILLCFLFIGSFAVPAFAAGDKGKASNEKVISFQNPNGRVISVAKYGNVRQFPANSVEGIVNCIDLGIDIITVSVQKTKDGQFVLLSTNDLSKVCCGKEGVAVAGKASDCTLEDLQNTYFLKSGYGGSTAEPTEYKVASLLDAIAAADGKAMIMINNGWKYAEEINKLAAEKECADMLILRGAKNVDEISAFTAKYGNSACRVAASFNSDKDDGSAKTYVTDALNAGAFMVELGGRKSGSSVFKYPVLDKFAGVGRAFVSTTKEDLCGGREDRQAAWSDLIERGFSVIETDYPRELANYLNEIETYRTELTSLITRAQGIERALYTEASVKTLDASLEEAIAVTSKGCIALDEIDTARYHIQESLDGLVIATGNEKTTLPTWLIVLLVAAGVIFVVASVLLTLRYLNKARTKKRRFERFKRTFKSEIPTENDESLKTNIAEDLESNRGLTEEDLAVDEPEPGPLPEPESVPEPVPEPAPDPELTIEPEPVSEPAAEPEAEPEPVPEEPIPAPEEKTE